MRRFAVVTLIALAAVLADAAEGDLTLDAVPESKSVKLGEDAVLLVTLTNHTATSVKAPALRLAKDSVSVRITAPGATASTVTRLYGSFLENDAGELEFRPRDTPMRTLEAGASLQGRIAVPALVSGPIMLTAEMGTGAAHFEAKSVTFDVQSRQRVAAQVETTKGALRIDLDASGSYASVANFWMLAREGFFDGLPFHRVVGSILAQTGDPRGTGTGGPGWYVPGETPVAASTRGDVGLARGAHADSGGSQWFVVADGKSALAGGYVRLGNVTEGLDVIDRLAANASDPKTGQPRSPDRVVSVKTVVR